MQLSKNIHDGHCPGILRPENLQQKTHWLELTNNANKGVLDKKRQLESGISVYDYYSPYSADWTPKLLPQREPHKVAPVGLSHRPLAAKI